MAEKNFRDSFVVDTSLFLTQHIRKDNEPVENTVDRLIDLIERADRKDIVCYMPPSTYNELMEILDGKIEQETEDKLKTWIVKKSPTRYEVKVSGEIMHDFVEEMRKRVDRGLRLSEKALRELEEMEEEPEEEYYSKSDVAISDLRDDYKEALRKGIVDSREDLDLLLLAKEMDATVVTEDNGVLNWAEDFGLRQIRGREFPDILEEYTDKS